MKKRIFYFPKLKIIESGQLLHVINSHHNLNTGKCAKYIGDEVSTYNLILPEAQLSENNDDKIASINETMNGYLKRSILKHIIIRIYMLNEN